MTSGTRAALTVSSGPYGNVSRMEDVFASGDILTCGRYGRVGRLTITHGIAMRHCARTETRAQCSTGGFVVECGE